MYYKSGSLALTGTVGCHGTTTSKWRVTTLRLSDPCFASGLRPGHGTNVTAGCAGSLIVQRCVDVERGGVRLATLLEINDKRLHNACASYRDHVPNYNMRTSHINYSYYIYKSQLSST